MKTITSISTALFLIASGLSASAQIVYLEDSFALNGTTRTAGTALTNIPVEDYDPAMFPGPAPIWKTLNNNTVFSAAGSIVSNGGGTMQGLVAVPNILTGTLTLKMDLTLGNADWVGFGFLGANGQTNWFDSTNPLFVAIDKSATVKLYRNGNSGSEPVLGSWNIANFDKDATYTLQLDYDRDNSAATIWLNDTLIVSGLSITGLNNSDISYVGFRANRTSPGSTDGSSFDNFSYMGTVPEPTSVVLLTAGLATMCFARRRKACRLFSRKS
jgi:hypothetical protein